MRIRKIKLENHPILGTIELDFTDKYGNTVDTVIIAGENGVGKSLLLNIIFEFSQLQIGSPQRDERRMFEIEFSESEIALVKESQNARYIFDQPVKNNIVCFLIDYNNSNDWGQYIVSAQLVDGRNIEPDVYLFVERKNNKSFFNMIFSNAEINFTPKPIQAITSKNIDRSDFKSEKSDSNLATEIAQLLIDIQTKDSLDFTEWARQNKGSIVDQSKIDTRIGRFTAAFEFMFPTKKYKRIEAQKNEMKIIFEENGKEMSIDELSSGEKQIVFRGGFLLKDKECSKDAVILIDEPEISLHPNWQLNILSFFKKLFTSTNGNQTSQLIVATHSPFIIHNSNRNADKVVILQKDEFGKITAPQDPKFHSWTPEELVKEAFNISQIINQDKITVLVEGETDEKYFKKCMELFGHQDKKMEFTWVGRINESGKHENTGDTALNQAYSFFRANMQFLKTTLVLLYDSDRKKPEGTFGNLMIRCVRTNSSNTTFKIGIENLLSLPTDFDLTSFYKTEISSDPYGGKTTIEKLQKNKLCNWICENLETDKQRVILAKLNDEIERIYNDLKV